MYPEEDIEIIFKTNNSLYSNDVELGSQIFKVEKVYPFPFKEKYEDKNRSLIFLVVFGMFITTIIGILVGYDYKKLKDQKPE